MPRTTCASLALTLLAVLTQARAADTPTSLDTYHELVQVDGGRVGHVSTTVQRHGPDGKQTRTTQTLELTLRRYGALVRLRREVGSVESAEGNVVTVWMRQGQVGARQLVLNGTVVDDQLHVRVDDGRIDRRIRWPAGVLGLRGEEQFLVRRKPRSGDRFHYLRYEPTYNAVLTIRAVVKERERVEVDGTRKELLRIELTPDPLAGAGQKVQPARSIWWVDEAMVPHRRQTELDGLGTLTLMRAQRDRALAPITAPAADIGTRSLIRLDRAIARPYDTRQVRYRVNVLGMDDPADLLVQDTHQEVRNVKGRSFELVVHPARVSSGTGDGEKPGPEFLSSCFFIDHEEGRVRELARRAVAGETNPWRKALRIERFVKELLRNDSSAALVPASTIARTPRGDCRHHAFLTAALCRAQGIPARTAIGLLYVYRGGPRLAFHMWAEVHDGISWRGLDSTLGKGGVSATHIKVSDASWHGVASLTPLLAVQRLLGKLEVAVLEVSH